jgi:hypothetical protein
MFGTVHCCTQQSLISEVAKLIDSSGYNRQIFLGATLIRFSIVMFHTVIISSNPWRANRMYRFLGCTCLVFCSIDIQNMVIGFVQKRKLGAVTGAKKRAKMQTFSK